ncbi:hypothetical protein R6Q57_015937 [Mikania cordata]
MGGPKEELDVGSQSNQEIIGEVAKPRNRTAELAAPSGGAFALAVLCNKALFPVRVPITIALTPPIARVLARRKIINMLSQIKPQAPLLVVPFRQFLSFRHSGVRVRVCFLHGFFAFMGGNCCAIFENVYRKGACVTPGNFRAFAVRQEPSAKFLAIREARSGSFELRIPWRYAKAMHKGLGGTRRVLG